MFKILSYLNLSNQLLKPIKILSIFALWEKDVQKK